MSEPAYSLEAWLRFQEEKKMSKPEPVPVETTRGLERDEALPASIFDGKRYTPEEWVWYRCVSQNRTKPEPDETCPAHWADCGGTRIWIVKDGSRWLMYAGSRRADSRRTDFVSPFLNHAMQTTEGWYGPPRDGWHAEKHTAKSSQ